MISHLEFCALSFLVWGCIPSSKLLFLLPSLFVIDLYWHSYLMVFSFPSLFIFQCMHIYWKVSLSFLLCLLQNFLTLVEILRHFQCCWGASLFFLAQILLFWPAFLFIFNWTYSDEEFAILEKAWGKYIPLIFHSELKTHLCWKNYIFWKNWQFLQCTVWLY